MNRRNLAILLSILYIPPLSYADIGTGADLSLMVFYLIPIGACAWFAGTIPAIGAAVLAFVAWTIAQVAVPGDIDISPAFILVWGAVEKMLVFSGLILLVIRIRKLIAAERARALTDYATGLPNRRAFNAALVRAKAAGEPFSLAFLELEGLDALYSDRGEDFVDAILKQMAKVCRKLAPGYRYSDERFAALMPGLDGSAGASRMDALMERLVSDVLRPKGLDFRFKIAVAYCPEAAKLAIPQLLRFLAGAMINLHEREGNLVEHFTYARAGE
jgi:GGDEF domain-containing protein